MSLLLALDTSGAAVTVALARVVDEAPAAGEAQLLAERGVELAGQHAERLAPMVAEVLDATGYRIADVGTVAVGVGPGPFTGLRVGLVTARVLGQVLDVPVLGVCSLDALALQLIEAGGLEPGTRFVVATDARRREVYWAEYRAECRAEDRTGSEVVVGGVLPQRLSRPAVDRPAELAARLGDEGGPVPVFGRGARLYPELLGVPPEGLPLDVAGGAVARCAAVMRARGELLEPTPMYLRRPDAVAPGVRKRVR